MSKTLSEDSEGKRASANEFGTRQLFRRPAPNKTPHVWHIKVFSDVLVVSSGDSKFIFEIPEDTDGWNLTAIETYVTTVSSSGKPTVQIRNITQAVDMLTTKCEIDVSEKNSKDAGTQAVIDTGNDDVAWGDHIAIDVDVAGTGAKGLGVILTFEPT